MRIRTKRCNLLLIEEHSHPQFHHIAHIEVAVAILIEHFSDKAATRSLLDFGTILPKHFGKVGRTHFFCCGLTSEHSRQNRAENGDQRPHLFFIKAACFAYRIAYLALLTSQQLAKNIRQ